MNNADSLVEAAIADMGIVMISNFIAANAISNGQLKAILTDYVSPGPKVYVVYPPESHCVAETAGADRSALQGGFRLRPDVRGAVAQDVWHGGCPTVERQDKRQSISA